MLKKDKIRTEDCVFKFNILYQMAKRKKKEKIKQIRRDIKK